MNQLQLASDFVNIAVENKTMNLDEQTTIEKDSRCWILTQRVSEAKDKEGNRKLDKETGEPLWNEDQTYHANLGQALTYYLDNCLKPSQTLTDVLTAIKDCEARLRNAGVRL